MLLERPDLARGAVLVDVGPELSAQGTQVIANFVVHNVEFDDLEEFLDNVAKYDRFRSREHIARTVKYNMLRRADGKYISKVDHRRIPVSSSEMTFERATTIACPVLLVRGAESDVLEPEAAQRFADALPNGMLVTVEKTGHNVHSGNTPGFLEAIGPFVAGIDPA
jgi:pimeloyl-ACP methyl ester carboxylesterase